MALVRGMPTWPHPPREAFVVTPRDRQRYGWRNHNQPGSQRCPRQQIRPHLRARDRVRVQLPDRVCPEAQTSSRCLDRTAGDHARYLQSGLVLQDSPRVDRAGCCHAFSLDLPTLGRSATEQQWLAEYLDDDSARPCPFRGLPHSHQPPRVVGLREGQPTGTAPPSTSDTTERSARLAATWRSP